jgi:hypothetical protein
LLEADIEVIELIPVLRAARKHHPLVFYDGHDQHPADGGIQVAAGEIARRLARYDLAKEHEAHPLKLELRPTEILKVGVHGESRYPATQVWKDGKPLEIGEDTGSPVLVLGDSYTVVPGYYPPGGSYAGLPFHLAYRLGIVPDHLARMGDSGNALKMLAEQGPGYLAGRRAVVFIFSPNRLFNNEYVKGVDSWKPFELPAFPAGK